MKEVKRWIVGLVVMMTLVGAQIVAAEPIKLLAFGDSLTEGYGLSNSADGFVPQLERALQAEGWNVEVINGGIAGDSTQGGLERLGWSLMDGPDVAILELGANDMLRGFDPALTRANLMGLLDGFHEAGVPVLLTGMRASPSMGVGYVEAFDAIYPELAEVYADKGVSFYPFFLDGVVADRRLNQADGLHPTAKGVQVIIERILPSVLELVDSVSN